MIHEGPHDPRTYAPFELWVRGPDDTEYRFNGRYVSLDIARAEQYWYTWQGYQSDLRQYTRFVAPYAYLVVLSLKSGDLRNHLRGSRVVP